MQTNATDGNWNTPLKPIKYDMASIALSDVETARRGEAESRLRLININYIDEFGDLFMSEPSTSVEMALTYVSFTQLCKVLGLTSQIDFLRGLNVGTVARILKQYTDDLSDTPTEIKMSVRRESHAGILGSIVQLYVVKRVSTRLSTQGTPNDRWLYWLAQFESYGWAHAEPLTLCDDHLTTVMYDSRTPIGAGSLMGYLGFMVSSSEALTAPARTSAVVWFPELQQWLPINEPLIGKQLANGLAEALSGNVGMFGPLSSFRESVPASQLKFTLQANATTSVDAVTAVRQLTSAGFTTDKAAKIVASVMQADGRVTYLATVLSALKSITNDNGLPAMMQKRLQLGWSLWK